MSLNQALHDTHKSLFLQLREVQEHYSELEKIIEHVEIHEEAWNVEIVTLKEVIGWKNIIMIQ